MNKITTMAVVLGLTFGLLIASVGSVTAVLAQNKTMMENKTMSSPNATTSMSNKTSTNGTGSSMMNSIANPENASNSKSAGSRII